MENVIVLPEELYDAVRRKAAAQRKTADALVIEWVSEQLDEWERGEIIQAFEAEVAAFEQLRPALLELYADQYVAIYQGQVVASGNEKLALLDEVRQKFGNVVCYIEKVAVDSPRTVHMPSVRIARYGMAHRERAPK